MQGCAPGSSDSSGAVAGSCLDPGYYCDPGSVCCDGSNRCVAGKCYNQTLVQCAAFDSCDTCTPEVGCAFCKGTGRCLDEFGVQGPDWDSCADLRVAPEDCSAPPVMTQPIAPGGTSTQPGTGGGSTPQCQGCLSPNICVNLSGSAVCEATCSTSSQCASGCCSALQGTNAGACLPASYCSNGGTGGGGQSTPQCQNCSSPNVCVNINGSAVCEASCSTSSQCASGCCTSLQGSNAGACVPASFCAGGGGTPGGGGTTTCKNIQASISTRMSSDPDCAGYAALINNLTTQVACKYTLSNGQTGCVYPGPGAHECAFYLSKTTSWQLLCADGQIACDNAIGCSL